MPEIPETRLRVACEDVHEQVRAAVGALAQVHDVRCIDLTMDLAERLVSGLAEINPDAALTLLSCWADLITHRFCEPDETALIDPEQVRRDLDGAAWDMRAATEPAGAVA